MPDISTGLVTDNVPKLGSLVPIAVSDILVRAVGQKNANLRFADKNGIGPIPRECDVTFEIANPGRRRPGASIGWIVHNEGTEAEMVNDLGHRAGSRLTGSKAFRLHRYALHGLHSSPKWQDIRSCPDQRYKRSAS
jgi:Adenylyl/Guanylyl and SMODS C-terminal sensor domain